MLERLTQQLGLQFAKLQFGSQSEPPRQMTGFLRTASNVLITLPIQYDAAAAAGAALHQIRNQLSQAHITLVHTSTWETPASVPIVTADSGVLTAGPLTPTRFAAF